MKVNSYKNNVTFNGLYNSRLLKRGLEFAADNGALFAATTTLVLSAAVRPVSILLTPKTDKENKRFACAKSLASSLIGYGMMLGVSRPITNAIKKIEQNPQKYLTQQTIQNFKIPPKSKAYILATQLLKLGLGAIIAAPKAILTTLALPLFLIKNETQTQNPTFTGKEKLPNKISKILNRKWLQEFSKKHENSNFPMHITALTDTVTTATFIKCTQKSKQISEERKKPLIYNAAISTGLCIGLSYITDKILDKPTEKFIENFKKANKSSPKLDKYVEGIKIAKPILILGGIYYSIIPVISTFISDKIKS